MDETAALRPLIEAADDLHRLDHYDTTEDLAAAITAVADALERALRLRLRTDRTAPEAHRINALSRELLPFDEVVRSLRTRDLISLEAAGTLHEARTAAERAGTGSARAADAAAVRAAVAHLRQELGQDAAIGSVGPDAAGPADEQRAVDEPPAEEEQADRDEKPAPADEPAVAGSGAAPASDARWMRWIAATFAAAMLVGVAWVALRGGGQEYDDAVVAFRAGRLDSAAVGFERVLEDRPDDVTVMLYLARSYRRLDRHTEAAALLRRAVDRESEDGDVRRELGHLFMELDRPRPAVEQYERALEYDPENPRNWAALIRALRTVEDPRAEQLLRDAPEEVQAVLSGA